MGTDEHERLHFALIGTRGVPARYGGFETAVEEVGARLADRGHRVTVYCRRAEEKLGRYRGMELVHLPAPASRVAETLAHSALSMLHALVRRPDVAIVFNAANAPLLPLLKLARIPFATHVDGLEWKRDKWGRVGRRYYQIAERLAVRWSPALIADAVGIQDHYRDHHGAAADFIPYGAPIIEHPDPGRLDAIGLRPQGYHLVVARFEPENNVHTIVEGYRRSEATQPLVVVGSAPYAADYTRQINALASGDPRIRLLGGIWDAALLDQLYANALSYLHGHSVGGTNPSLLRAMGAAAPVIALDVVFNREVAGDSGRYFADPDGVAELVVEAERSSEDTRSRGLEGRTRVAARYDWDEVAHDYERLGCRLAASGR